MYELREYQKEAAAKALDFLYNKKEKSGAIEVLPTGSGKSLVIAEIARNLDDKTLVFQPSKEILEQNYNKMLSYGYSDCSIYSASMNKKEISKVTFATIGSVAAKPEMFSNFKYVIVDECHLVNSKGGQYSKFFEGVGEKFLGLTATPYRLNTDGFGGSMLKFITRTRPSIFKKVVFVVQTKDLFEQGYLAKLNYSRFTEFDSSRLTLNTTGNDYTDDSVKKYYHDLNFTQMLYATIDKMEGLGRTKILVFTKFVDEALALEKQYSGQAAVVSATMNKNEREDVIKRFKDGSIKIVANVGVLTVGFDYPELDTVIIARPTRSLALYYQMIGRGVRIHPNKEYTQIVDMCNNYKRFGKVEDLMLVEPKKNLWHVESNNKQLTNVYYV